MLMDSEEFFFLPILIFSLTHNVGTNLITAKSSPTMPAKPGPVFLQEVWFYPLVSPAFST